MWNWTQRLIRPTPVWWQQIWLKQQTQLIWIYSTEKLFIYHSFLPSEKESPDCHPPTYGTPKTNLGKISIKQRLPYLIAKMFYQNFTFIISCQTKEWQMGGPLFEKLTSTFLKLARIMRRLPKASLFDLKTASAVYK